MRRLIFIPLLFIYWTLSATTYYVATAGGGGNDSNPGTIGSPWLTWQKAFTSSSVQPGDTVYFRGGIYQTTITDGTGIPITRSGTVTDTLCYFAYPGEKPIMDFSNIISSLSYQYGVSGNALTYVKFKGLTFRNMVRQSVGYEAYMVYIATSTGVVLENCTAYNVWGDAFESRRNYRIHYINCDAYNCCDTVPRTGGYPGERGTGFHIQNTDKTTATTYYTNCRAWNCSDQGFSFYDIAYVEMDGCWSWGHGGLDAGGHGIKIGFRDQPGTTDLKRKIVNCVAAYNRSSGITTNLRNKDGYGMQIYNNTAYHNGFYPGWTIYVWGVVIYNTLSSDAVELAQVFKNNISDGNRYGNIYVATGALYTHSENNWDIPLTLTTADYLSIDSTGITAARQADGSLPDNDCYNKFLHLSATSRCIDAGIDLGYGDDIGAFQYAVQEDPEEPYVLSELSTFKPYWQTETTAISGGNVYDDGGDPGGVIARGVCWNTTGTPTTADSKTEDGTGTGIFYSTMTGLSQGTPYYVRAYATNSVGTAYGNQMTFRVTQAAVKEGKMAITKDGKAAIID